MASLREPENPITANQPKKDSTPEESSTDKEKEGQEWKHTADDPPDGGTAAWLVVLGGWCVMFCSFGWISSIGVFQAYYMSDLLREYSSSKISWIPSLQIFFMFATGPIVGQIYDRFGPRYLLLIGSFLHVFGLMMTSLSKEYYQILLSQGVCSAIGVAAIFQPTVSTLPSWFNKKRGAVYGIAATGSSFGGVIFPIMISRLIRQVGFPWTMRISAFIILFLMVIANLTVKSRLPPNPRKLSKESLTRPFREIKMILLLIGFLILTFGFFVPMNYIVSEAIARGMSHSLADYLAAILNAGSLIGRLGAGIVADKLGTYNIFAIVSYFAGILILALWIPTTGNVGVIVFAVLFGFATGAYVALASFLVVRISPLEEVGYRTGLLFLCASVGGLTTNPIAGAMLERTHGSYADMKIFAGVLLLVGSTVVFGVRVHQTGLELKAVF
ncbi:MFS general substrate transporter [Aspergillus avenaceus]|uniref:MFS general substrate transporter n=1 Tax=Aspergillus avenaceus TaxID=36643 RepID=A0A5N6U7J3_ASPAV|nr:MFS general substrate transporter [Aspergillus avenaceus]